MTSIEASGGDYNAAELSIKLTQLLETFRKPGEPPLSYAAAAEGITAKTGVTISVGYFWKLCNGVSTNPTIQHLQAIAKFFGVTPSYLINPGIDKKIDDQLNALQLMRDSGVRDMAARAHGLSPQALESLAAMIDHARQLEQLPPVAPRTGR